VVVLGYSHNINDLDMEEQKKISKSRMAAIFGINRTTIYSWEAAGCPVKPPVRPGAYASLDFEEVLTWHLCQLEAHGHSEEWLEITEKVARGRLSKFLDRQKVQACPEEEVQTSVERL